MTGDMDELRLIKCWTNPFISREWTILEPPEALKGRTHGKSQIPAQPGLTFRMPEPEPDPVCWWLRQRERERLAGVSFSPSWPVAPVYSYKEGTWWVSTIHFREAKIGNIVVGQRRLNIIDHLISTGPKS